MTAKGPQMRLLPALMLTLVLTGAVALAPYIPVKAAVGVPATVACSVASAPATTTASVMGSGYFAPPPVIPVS